MFPHSWLGRQKKAGDAVVTMVKQTAVFCGVSYWHSKTKALAEANSLQGSHVSYTAPWQGRIFIPACVWSRWYQVSRPIEDRHNTVIEDAAHSTNFHFLSSCWKNVDTCILDLIDHSEISVVHLFHYKNYQLQHGKSLGS